jgi:hypothetical protein
MGDRRESKTKAISLEESARKLQEFENDRKVGLNRNGRNGAKGCTRFHCFLVFELFGKIIV